MKQFVRSVPAMLFLSVASLSLIALAGCGASGSGSVSGPAAAKNIYAIQKGYNNDTCMEQDSVLVFSASATGSTTPTSTLALPSSLYAYSIAIGPQGQIYVGGTPSNGYADYGQILEYPAGSSGSATPNVTLNGSGAGTTTFTTPGELAVNSAGTLVVSSWDGSLETFASGFTASSAPTQYLTWGAGKSFGGFIGVDTAGDIFYIAFGYGGIEVFAANTTGATAPTRQITGTNINTEFDIKDMTVDGAGDVYVTNYDGSDDTCDGAQTTPGTNVENQRTQAVGSQGASRSMAHPHIDETDEPTEILEFAAGATGNATPLKRIEGSATNIIEPEGLAVDAIGNLYYADANGGYPCNATPGGSNPANQPALLEVFSASAAGNVAPIASMTPTGVTYGNFRAVAVY